MFAPILLLLLLSAVSSANDGTRTFGGSPPSSSSSTAGQSQVSASNPTSFSISSVTSSSDSGARSFSGSSSASFSSSGSQYNGPSLVDLIVSIFAPRAGEAPGGRRWVQSNIFFWNYFMKLFQARRGGGQRRQETRPERNHSGVRRPLRRRGSSRIGLPSPQQQQRLLQLKIIPYRAGFSNKVEGGGRDGTMPVQRCCHLRGGQVRAFKLNLTLVE